MASEIKFANEETYQTIDRKELMIFINVASSGSPDWAPLGIGVNNAAQSYDWQRESKKDIWGNTYNTMKTPLVSTELDEWPVAGNDKAQRHIWELAVVNQDHTKLSAQDILVVHEYAHVGVSTKLFAERYDATSVEVTSLGGEGGGTLVQAASVSYGGTRTIGSATLTGGTVSFTEGLE